MLVAHHEAEANDAGRANLAVAAGPVGHPLQRVRAHRAAVVHLRGRAGEIGSGEGTEGAERRWRRRRRRGRVRAVREARRFETTRQFFLFLSLRLSPHPCRRVLVLAARTAERFVSSWVFIVLFTRRLVAFLDPSNALSTKVYYHRHFPFFFLL